MLNGYLTKDRIKLKIKAADWQEVVKEVGEVMYYAGDIDANYIDAMRKAIEELGPYSVLAPGIVLLHARPEDGVKKTSCVITTLENGVDFGSKYDPVFLAIGLGAVDTKSHIELLKDISILLQDENIVSKLNSFKKRDALKALAFIQEYPSEAHH